MIYFVATPIGNLKDITLRALETLRAADAIFCEDTRHSLKLLSAYEIHKPLYSCHKFNEREAAEKMIALDAEGKNVCVLSDAGMPVVSDPGNVVGGGRKEGGRRYSFLRGASSFLCAFVFSPFPADKFTFLGFLPEKAGERKSLLAKYRAAEETLIFHCAPQDVDRYVSAMYEAFGDRRACAVREISKIHEESMEFTLKEGLAGEMRGEYVLLVEGARERENPLNKLSAREHTKEYIRQGLSKQEAVKKAARDRGVSKNEVYKVTLDL